MSPSQFRETTSIKIQRARDALRRSMRTFFTERGYLEVETPVLVQCPGTEVHLNYFETNWQDYSGKKHLGFLRTSPEIHMKQLLADGAERIFQLARCFRNGGELSSWHHPEFTMLEWYRTAIGFEEFMDETTELLKFTNQEFIRLGLGGVQLPAVIERMSIYDAFQRFVGIELIDGDPDLAKKARSIGNISVRPDDDFETSYFKLLLDLVEPEFEKMGVVLVYDFPPSQAALSRVVDNRAKRFEIYFGRTELCNAFWELTDKDENLKRLRESNLLRRAAGKTVPLEDQGFELALNKGIPECCGNALGFDRWLSILLGAGNLSNAVPFRNCAPFLADE
jgi:lysyl-tRNA synthetase class 2